MKTKWLFIGLLFFCSCVTVKPSERIFLNKSDMQMETGTGKNFENYIFSVREAATPSGGSKSSGGCGCN